MPKTFATGGGGSGIENVVEDTTPQLGGDLDLNGKNIDFPTTANISDCLDEDNMVSNSATKLATQQSIKAYADTNMAGWTHVHATRTTNLTMTKSSWTTVILPSEFYDVLGEYNTSTGLFTATAEGYYTITANMVLDSAAWVAANYLAMGVFTDGDTPVSVYVNRWIAHANVTTYASINGAVTIHLDAGETFYLKLLHNRDGGDCTIFAGGYWNWMTIDRIA